MNAAMGKTDEPGETHPVQDHQGWPAAAEAGDDTALPDRFDLPLSEVDGPATRPGIRSASDAQLATWIEAMVDHDEQALAALYDATFSRVFGLVQRIVRNTAMAEEVVEDDYFQVWQQAVRFDPVRGKPLTRLLAMARSRASQPSSRTLSHARRPGTAGSDGRSLAHGDMSVRGCRQYRDASWRVHRRPDGTPDSRPPVFAELVATSPPWP